MGELLVDDIIWKKGETGDQQFEIHDSDGTLRNLSGNTYTFHFWVPDETPEDKGTGGLSLVDALNGLAKYTLAATDTDTVETYDGEIIENPGSDDLKSNTFTVYVKKAGP